MTEKVTILSLFSKHQKYCLKLFYTYYPLSNELLRKFEKEVNWSTISQNEKRTWDQPFIAEFSDKLNWEFLSSNPSLPWSVPFLKSFPGKFKGEILTINPNLPWDYDFITQYESFWNIYSLPLNTGIQWTSKLILHPKVIDKNLSEVNGADLWTEKFLIENAEILPWEFLCLNPYIQWTEDLIDKLCPFWEEKENQSNKYSVSPWKGLCSNPSVPWTTKLIKKYQKSLYSLYGVDWTELSRNPNLPWQEENLLDQFKEKWNWNILSVNNGVEFTEQQIEKYKDLLTWDSGSSSNQNIAANMNLPWSIEFIKKYRSKWQWWTLCRNVGVHLNEEMISKFEKEIIWESLAHNLSLPWSLDFVLKYEDELFKNWSYTTLEFDQIIWNKVFEPLITDEIAEQILYDLSNPFQAIKTFNNEISQDDVLRKNIEVLTKRILKINSNTNPYLKKSAEIDLFLSIIQTTITQILIASENELKILLNPLTDLYNNSDRKTQTHLRSISNEIHDEILILFSVYGIDRLAREVVLKQKEMNEASMEFAKQGGHVSQDYSFLHNFIQEYGKRNFELARIWVILEDFIQ
jgi:hypothetical protein